MPGLEISLLGPPRLRTPAGGRERSVEGPAGDLLTCLVLNRDHPVRRESLVAWLWPDIVWQSGRRRLNTTLYRLRSLLEPDASRPRFLLSPSRREIVFSSETDCWLDLDVFERTVARLVGPGDLGRHDVAQLDAAVALYRGDLCESANGTWVVSERVRLANLALAARTKLAEAYLEFGKIAPALRHALAVIEADPLREDIHRIIMRCHLVRGDRATALGHFEQLKRALSDELDAYPMPETTQLAAAIAQGKVSLAPANIIPAADVIRLLEEASTGMRSLLESLDEAVAQLRNLNV